MPLVSVVVPNYNHARYLPKRLESILGQTLPDFELIFLDDASSDNSIAVFQHYAEDPRIRAYYSDSNSGSPFRQWNRGMAESTGRYIWIAESDDFCEPDFLEVLVARLEANPACGVAFAQSQFVDPEDHVTGTYVYGQFADKDRWLRDYTVHGPDELRRYFTIANVIPNASAALFRADLVRSGNANDKRRNCRRVPVVHSLRKFNRVLFGSDSR